MATEETSEVKKSTAVNTKICLESIKRLRVEKEIIRRIRYVDTGKRLVKKEYAEEVFDLEEVDKTEIKRYRMQNVASFVLKVGDKYYYTKINKKINFRSKYIYIRDDEEDTFEMKKAKLDLFHKCSQCRKAYPAMECDGGCEKVLNVAKFIEKYDWITMGYETFGTDRDVFVVFKCSNYEEYSDTKRKIKITDGAMYNLIERVLKNK